MIAVRRIGSISLLAVVAACVAQPPARPAISTLPPLQAESSRFVIGAGMQNRGDMQAVALANVRQVGPVYIDGRYVGSTGQNEYFVVDVTPGKYELACSPQEPVRNVAEKKSFGVAAGETKYLSCEMASAKSDLGPEYLSKTYLEERPLDLDGGKLVGYSKLP